jgi:hypothetical protein
MRGLWLGRATQSPYGEVPYALMFHTEGTLLVAETPAPPGKELPPGAYQRFTLSREEGRLTYKVSLGQGFRDGVLVESRGDDPSKLTYCAGDGCDRMRVSFDLKDEANLSFKTWIDGQLHTDIVLAAEKMKE